MKKQTLLFFAGGGCPPGCSGGTCPTVYKSSDGRFYVQGYRVPKDIVAQVDLGDDELLVEVDPTLIENIMKATAR
jgi:hypothetical protein